MDLEKYKTLFVDEAGEHLGEMGRAVALLGEGASGDPAEEAIDTLFRMAHSIKGMAASMEYESIAGLAHRLEDRMEPLRGSSGSIAESELALISDVISAVYGMVASVEETGISPDFDPGLLDRLSAKAAKKKTARGTNKQGLKKKVPRSLRHRCRVPSACAQKRWTGFWPRWVN